MKDVLKLIGMWVLIITTITSVLLMIYSLVAGIWQYNPTGIEWFNMRMFITSLVVFVCALGVITFTEHDND